VDRPSVGAARLFVIAGALSVGVVLAGMFHPVVLGVVLPAALTLLVTAWRRTVAVLLAAALALGFALAGLRLASIHGSALAHGAARNADALLTGQVVELRGGTLHRFWTTKVAPATRYVAISLWPG